MEEIMNSKIPPAKAMSQLNESLAHTAQSQRELMQELTCFARQESLRFVNLRLERNGAALDKLQGCQGLSGLIGVQQQWLRDFIEDYAAQNLRVAGALRGLAHNVMASATEIASDGLDHLHSQPSDTVEQASETAKAAQDAASPREDNQQTQP